MIPGPEGDLESLIDRADGRSLAIAVVCHPHPLHGGSMRNKVAHTLAKTFVRLGATSIRFNFRGVGGSAGSHANGEGELLDALAVVDWAAGRWQRKPVYLAGFSFGAMIALRAAAARSPAGLATVAPAVDRFDFELERPGCPWLVVQGSDDDVVAAASVERWCGAIVPPPTLRVVESAGHFFHGKLRELEDVVREFFGPLMRDRARARAPGC